ncbi:MAG: hypothetical protein KBF27_09405, partial [Cypionkella sp.]|nr:hypothetical protein [Cypionkella sp.]
MRLGDVRGFGFALRFGASAASARPLLREGGVVAACHACESFPRAAPLGSGRLLAGLAPVALGAGLSAGRARTRVFT